MGNKVTLDSYNRTALHFDKLALPPILENHLQNRPISLADVGCGDGPWFSLLLKEKIISPAKPVYAVDLAVDRLNRIQHRFPWIVTMIAPADNMPQIPSQSLDWVFSTMVMEHVPSEEKYLSEIYRILRRSGKAYITTVFKNQWAWYFRKRDGQSVLDPSHLREYTDLNGFRHLVKLDGKFNIADLELFPMWFPLLDPVLFRLRRGEWQSKKLVRGLRGIKVPIIGYYELHVILTKK